MGLGGAQRVTLNLVHWINNNSNNEAFILMGNNSGKGDFMYPLEGIRHHILPKSQFARIIELRKQLIKERPEVLITMGMSDTIYDSIACIGLPVKHIISERNDPRNFNGKFITKWISRFLACFADGYVFQTKEAMNYYRLSCFKKGTVIPNPLIGLNQMPEKPFDGKRRKEIVAVGRLNIQKNHPLLIRAFADVKNVFPEYNLRIYGEGPTKNDLIRLIEELGLHNRVYLSGAVNNIFSKIYDAELFVLSSNFEGMPNALMEAMALGIPCISTDCPCGGPRELINNGQNGLLVNVKDQAGLKTALTKMLSQPELRQKIGINGFNIRKEFGIEIISKRWLDYITQITEK